MAKKRTSLFDGALQVEIELLGIQKDNFSLPEYKAVMREVETLE